MGRPSNPTEAWHQRAAELMVRQSMSLRLAAQALEIPLKPEEAEKLFRSKNFQALLWIERNKYQQEIARDPSRSKESAIGLAVLAAQKLAEMGEWDKVVDAIFKLGKLEGWVGADNPVNVFGTLSAEELEVAKKRIKDAVERKKQELVN